MAKAKLSNAAKEENEFQKLARLAMSNKDQQILERKFRKEASRIDSAVELLGVVGKSRDDFIMAQIELQAVAGEYNKTRQYNTENWTKSKQNEYKNEVKEYHKKLTAIYRNQKELQIKILEYHLQLEKKLGFTFDISQNNVYMVAYISCKAMEFDKGVNSNAN
ncbi:MAG: hypothetical protein EOL97_15260 [Spirochaetia bacterium]|nr:hypothetical protein [Spirochaetia bacterium]